MAIDVTCYHSPHFVSKMKALLLFFFIISNSCAGKPPDDERMYNLNNGSLEIHDLDHFHQDQEHATGPSKKVKRAQKDDRDDFLCTLREQFNFPKENVKNCELSTLAVNSLMLEQKESDDIKVCCPKSLIEWQLRHDIHSSHHSLNCTVNIREPSNQGWSLFVNLYK